MWQASTPSRPEKRAKYAFSCWWSCPVKTIKSFRPNVRREHKTEDTPHNEPIGPNRNLSFPLLFPFIFGAICPIKHSDTPTYSNSCLLLRKPSGPTLPPLSRLSLRRRRLLTAFRAVFLSAFTYGTATPRKWQPRTWTQCSLSPTMGIEHMERLWSVFMITLRTSSCNTAVVLSWFTPWRLHRFAPFTHQYVSYECV